MYKLYVCMYINKHYYSRMTGRDVDVCMCWKGVSRLFLFITHLSGLQESEPHPYWKPASRLSAGL